MSRRWKAWFVVEAASLVLLCGHWLWAPGAHLGRLVGVDPGAAALMPLAHIATAALCAWTWLYLRLVLGGAEDRTFRRVQEALILAHVLLLSVGLGIFVELEADLAALGAFILANTLMLGTRLTYLFQTREVPWQARVPAAQT